jgi:hypothetical protein
MGVIDNSIIHVHDISQKLPSTIPQDSFASSVEHYIMPDDKYSARKGNFYSNLTYLIQTQNFRFC